MKFPHRPMTPDEREAIRMLSGVKFPHLTHDERIGSHLQKLAAAADPVITEPNARQAWLLLRRYQRQIRHPQRLRFLRLADKLCIPRKRLEMWRERSRRRVEARKALTA